MVVSVEVAAGMDPELMETTRELNYRLGLAKEARRLIAEREGVRVTLGSPSPEGDLPVGAHASLAGEDARLAQVKIDWIQSKVAAIFEELVGREQSRGPIVAPRGQTLLVEFVRQPSREHPEIPLQIGLSETSGNITKFVPALVARSGPGRQVDIPPQNVSLRESMDGNVAFIAQALTLDTLPTNPHMELGPIFHARDSRLNRVPHGLGYTKVSIVPESYVELAYPTTPNLSVSIWQSVP